MEYICHRVNHRAELNNIPQECGVELDLRDDLQGNIYLEHDPFVNGENFEDYLKEYHHGTLILNVKSERIEWKAKELLDRYGIKEYFFLDCSFPMIWELGKREEHNLAIRVSEFESLENARLMKNRARWIWLDCFSKLPIGVEEAQELKHMGYKLCLVSPELQGRPQDIAMYAGTIKMMEPDAICTKQQYIAVWERQLSIGERSGYDNLIIT